MIGVRRCAICGTTSDLIEQHIPGASGPGWTRVVCHLDAQLPLDPDKVPAVYTRLMLRRAGR